MFFETLRAYYLYTFFMDNVIQYCLLLRSRGKCQMSGKKDEKLQSELSEVEVPRSLSVSRKW